MYVLVGICISFVFGFLFACGYVALASCRHLYPKVPFGITIIAIGGTLLHILIAKQNGWDAVFPGDGKGMLLVVYLLDVFLWGSVFSYLIMRKFPVRAKTILNAVVGSK